MDTLEIYWNSMMDYLAIYLPKLLLAILVLIVGLWLIKKIVKGMDKVLEKKDIEISLRRFLESLTGIALKVLLIISVITMVGVETTSFVAVLAAAGFAIGMALQGGLANFAGGVMILIFKPFKVGDFITTNGHSGTVHAIEIFHTVIKTPDNVVIVLPNGIVSNNPITNFTKEDIRRVDFVFGIGYDDDIRKAKEMIRELIVADNRIMGEPEPVIVVSELADSSVNITVRVWSKKEDYWGIFFDMTENVKLTFDKEGISIPYPQTDIHLFNKTGD
jgi:small conductance mechanosensitive channel